MCTAATYKTKDFYIGRTLDYEFSYGEEVVGTPRNNPFALEMQYIRNRSRIKKTLLSLNLFHGYSVSVSP